MVAALLDETHVDEQRVRYRARRDVLRPALEAAGFRVDGSEAGLYLWVTRGVDAWQTIAELAELGIVFLLFLLGMELSMPRLWQLRRYVLGVGLIQVGCSIVAIGTLVRWAGLPPPTGLILGCALRCHRPRS